MNDNIEDIISAATLFAFCLAKDKSAKQLSKYKTFIHTLSNTLNLIIAEKSTKK